MLQAGRISAFQQAWAQRRMDLHRCVDNRAANLVPVFAYFLNFSVSSVVKLILSRTA